MRRTAWAVLVCVAATGCPKWPGSPPASVRAPGNSDPVRARSFSPGGLAGNIDQYTRGLYVESVLLERPVGDPFLDRELWTAGGRFARAVTPDPA